MSMMGIRTEWIDFMKGFILLFSIFMARFTDLNTSFTQISIFKKQKGAKDYGHK
jgi:hypothetical protein